LNQSETQDTGDDQKDRYDVIEQLRHNQNKDAGDQGDDRLKVRDAYGADGHSPIFPCWGFGSFGAAQDGHVRSCKRKYCERGGRPEVCLTCGTIFWIFS
jgi:hypothetical protein